MRELSKTKPPMVLTGRAAAVVQDAEAYQRRLDLAALTDAKEGIRQGTSDVKKGKVRPAREFFEEVESEHDLSG